MGNLNREHQQLDHLRGMDFSDNSTSGFFGSGNVGGETCVPTASWGNPACEKRLGSTEGTAQFPSFCGGEGEGDAEFSPMASPDMGADAPRSDTGHADETCNSLDFVVQNLQCRLGNYRNRCFANGPFRLWAWAGSFMSGPSLWSNTTAAVKEALGDVGVVNITTLETLAPLWETFNEAVQDDAAHFLQQLVELADSKRVIRQYHHVDCRLPTRSTSQGSIPNTPHFPRRWGRRV